MKISIVGTILVAVYLVFWGAMLLEYRQCMLTPSFFWDNLFCDLPLQIAVPLILVLWTIFEWFDWTTPSGILYIILYTGFLLLHLMLINLLGSVVESVILRRLYLSTEKEPVDGRKGDQLAESRQGMILAGRVKRLTMTWRKNLRSRTTSKHW